MTGGRSGVRISLFLPITLSVAEQWKKTKLHTHKSGRVKRPFLFGSPHPHGLNINYLSLWGFEGQLQLLFFYYYAKFVDQKCKIKIYLFLLFSSIN